MDSIWKKYDIDGNGLLDKEEVRQFVSDYVGSTGISEAAADQAFEAVFRVFDEDGSGSVDKSEVTAFIRKLVGSKAGNGKLTNRKSMKSRALQPGMDKSHGNDAKDMKSPKASGAKEESEDAEQVRSNAQAILANRRKE